MGIRENTEKRERQILSKRASLSVDSERRVQEEKCSMRTEYQRDRDRILHCNSFRRLMHKTQVFLSPLGDHYRTRLTHTLEVAQVAQTIARSLELNEDLTEAIALGHDLGHTPFGHAGEEVLNNLAPQGYHHSKQSVRVVEFLEHNGEGLNLTLDTINGIACHSSGEEAKTLEGQLIRYADKIAYMNHDIEDAISANIISEKDIPMDIKLDLGRTKSERLTNLITDLVENSMDSDSIKMSKEGKRLYNLLRGFLFESVYINSDAKKEEGKAKEVIKRLYEYYYNNPEKLPDFYRDIQEESGDIHMGVCDYISGMSDRFCVYKYEEIFIPKPFEVF